MNLPAKPSSSFVGKAQLSETGEYGVHDLMLNGFTSVRSQMCIPHPLEPSERTFQASAEKSRLSFLRSVQGIHAPLKILAEKRAVSQVGRLPFLPSSNIALETLEGRDEIIDVDDHIFGDPYEGVESLAPPHMVMEKVLFSKNLQ